MIDKRMKIVNWKRISDGDNSGDFTVFTELNGTEGVHRVRAHYWSDDRGNCGVEVTCSCGFEDSRIDTVGTNRYGDPHQFYKRADFHNILGTIEHEPLVI